MLAVDLRLPKPKLLKREFIEFIGKDKAQEEGKRGEGLKRRSNVRPGRKR